MFAGQLFAADAVIERYQNILQKNPKNGAVFERVYDYYVDTGETETFLNECKTKAENDPEKLSNWLLGNISNV